VLQRRPDHVEALIAMGLVLSAAGRPVEALPYFERASVKAPRAPTARAGLVHVHRTLGDREQAERELAALRRLDPRLAEQVDGR
jgi:Flp pilus assembly protein TadD